MVTNSSAGLELPHVLLLELAESSEGVVPWYILRVEDRIVQQLEWAKVVCPAAIEKPGNLGPEPDILEQLGAG